MDLQLEQPFQGHTMGDFIVVIKLKGKEEFKCGYRGVPSGIMPLLIDFCKHFTYKWDERIEKVEYCRIIIE